MHRTSAPAAMSVVCLLAVSLAGAHAGAIEPGGRCSLKAPLTVTIYRRAGSIEDTLERGSDVELISVSDTGIARVRAGDVKANVAFADLDSACSGTLRMCTLRSPVLMYEQNRSDSKSWRIKTGADVNILKEGKTWAAVRTANLVGFVKSGDMNRACQLRNAAAGATAPGSSDNGGGGTGEYVERGDGPGILLLPFDLEGGAPATTAAALFNLLFQRVGYYRPDSGRAGVDEKRKPTPLHEQIAAAARRAQGAGMAYALIGRFSLAPAAPGQAVEGKGVLELAVVDAKSAKVLKGVRLTGPTTQAADPWPERALAALLAVLAPAPGSKIPVPPGKSTVEVAPASPGTPAAPRPRTEVETRPDAPWFANGWGYLLFGGAVAAGVGSGFAGVLANDDNDRANAAVQTDLARNDHRNTALAEAITADSLGVVAAGAVIATVVVFATRAGLDDGP